MEQETRSAGKSETRSEGRFPPAVAELRTTLDASETSTHNQIDLPGHIAIAQKLED